QHRRTGAVVRVADPQHNSSTEGVKTVKNLTSSPDRKALSGLISGLAFIGGVGAGVASSNAPYPLPGSDPDKIRRYFRDNASSARFSAAGQLISAATLAQFTTSVVRL